VEFIQSLSRTLNGIFSTGADDSNSTTPEIVIAVPQTTLEKLRDRQPSSISYVPGEGDSASVGSTGKSFVISMVESSPRLRRIGTGANMVSNSVRVRVEQGGTGDVTGTIRYVLQNHIAQDYYELTHVNTTYETNCKPSMVNQTMNYTCPSGYTIYHPCNGSAIVWRSDCPRKYFQPICSVLNADGTADATADSAICTAVSFTAHNTTCECVFTPQSSKRRLASVQVWGSVEAVAVADYVYDDLKESFRYSDNISAGDLVSSIYVIASIVLLWGGGLLGTVVFSTVSYAKSTRVKADPASNIRGGSRRAVVDEDAQKSFILRYIDSVFPVVFQDSEWKWNTAWSEIKKHHPYMVMFIATGKGAQKRKFNKGVYLLSIQTMLMFILAVFYEMQVFHYVAHMCRCR
jgi:hypothetical protein